MTPWELGRELDAKAWEQQGHFLHYSHSILAWECWTHGTACCAISDGSLLPNNAAQS